MYKAVVSDLDGTLLNGNHAIDEFTKETVSEVIRPAMDRFYANNLDFNNAIKSMMEVFHNIQVPKIDSGILKSIQGLSDTIGHLGLPNTLNEPESEEKDEE